MEFSPEAALEPQPCSVCCGSKIHQCSQCYGSGNVICIGCFGNDHEQVCSICNGHKKTQCSLCIQELVSCAVCGGTGQRW